MSRPRLTKEEYARLKRLAGCAARLLVDPEFLDVLKALKDQAIRDWAATESLEADKREAAYRDLMAVGRLEYALKAFGQELRAEQDNNGGPLPKS